MSRGGTPLQRAAEMATAFCDPENQPPQWDMETVIARCREALNGAPEWVIAALDQLAIDIGMVNRGQWAVVKSGPMTRVVLAAALERSARNAEAVLIGEAMVAYVGGRITVNDRVDEVPAMIEPMKAHRRKKAQL